MPAGKHLNLKANEIRRQEKLVNILGIFKNHDSVERISLANFHFRSTLNISNVAEYEVFEVIEEILNLSSR